MNTFGYAAMGEQFHPTELMEYSKLAEEHGFQAVMVSDHFHPWTPQQGHSPNAWVLMGAIGATTNLRFGPGVSPPGWRYHPAIIAQAAATMEAMFPGRFFLGLGAGEALNEHIVGHYWPEPVVRLEVLADALEVIHKLFTGKVVKHRGAHFTLESARLYTMPEDPPPIYIATSGPINAERTGRTADGIITVGAADEKIKMLLERFNKGARDVGRHPSEMTQIIQLHVSWAESDKLATEQAVKEWPNGGMNFSKQDIRHPEDFEAMSKMVHADHFKGRVLISADLDAHREHIQHYIDLGFDEVYIHNVGRNQREFIEAYGKSVIPEIRWPQHRHG